MEVKEHQDLIQEELANLTVEVKRLEDTRVMVENECKVAEKRLTEMENKIQRKKRILVKKQNLLKFIQK